MKEEIWKDIPGYEGRYMVSTHGRVMSMNFEGRCGPRIMRGTNSHGYIIVVLYKDKKPKRYFAHRLVAITFIPNHDNKPFIDHIDTNRQNNHVENLRWCTLEENQNNPLTIKKFSITSTGRHHSEETKRKLAETSRVNARTPVIQMTLSGEEIREWQGMDIAASELENVNKKSISACCRGKYKTAGGYTWRYKYPNKIRRYNKNKK